MLPSCRHTWFKMAGVAAGAAVKAFTGLTGMAVAKVVFYNIIKSATSNQHIIFFIKSWHSPVITVPYINRNNFYSQKIF